KGDIATDISKLRPKEPLYTMLEDLDFSWYAGQVQQVIGWWNEGISIFEMGICLARDPDEIAMLIMDLARQGRIQKRETGALGV
ncbi:MAG: hypothetical protein ACYCX4_14785, partial [Bacillota bacterium]